MTDTNKEIKHRLEVPSTESEIAHNQAREKSGVIADQSDQGQTESLRTDIESIDQSPVVAEQKPVSAEVPLSDEQKAAELTSILNDHHKEDEFDLYEATNKLINSSDEE